MRIFRNLWRWFRREVRDPTARHLQQIGSHLERAARDWGTTLDDDLAELTSVMALAGALWVAGNKEAARTLYARAQRYASTRRDALLNAIVIALGGTSSAEAPAHTVPPSPSSSPGGSTK
ncbi:MAG: hypothetical protein V2G42_07100 [bacterium JZ-2024 1]